MRLNYYDTIIRRDMEEIFNRGYAWKDFEGKTFLVSGGYGMLASYCVLFLMYLKLEKHLNLHVIVQGRNKDKAKDKFAEYWDNDAFSFIDIDLLANLSELPKFDYVIHAAGISNPRCYSVMPVDVITPNVLGTYHLLELSRSRGIDKFLFFSSGDVYGEVPKADAITEETAGKMDTMDEHSCYGESKRCGETLCRAFFSQYGVPSVVVRIAHTYGPSMDPDKDPRVYACFMNNILKGEDIILHSDGRAKRPFCYISDATAAFMLLLLKGNPGEAYNMANTEQFMSIADLAKVIAAIPCKKHKIVYRSRSTDDHYLNNNINIANNLSNDKLKALGWIPYVDINEGFSRTYHYFSADRKR